MKACYCLTEPSSGSDANSGKTKAVLSKDKNLKVKASQIKDNITVFVNSTIEDPSFSSQTKETLTTKASLCNIKCERDDKFIQRI